MSMTESQLNERLLAFLKGSPTPFHAVANLAARLRDAGFQALDEREHWSLRPGGRYFVTRNGSSLVAFRLAEGGGDKGIRMVGAHTDSPCLRVKPSPEKLLRNYYQLGVEVYGGVLLAPWFDRDLSLAGRITYRTREGKIQSCLVDFKRPVAVIPSLAIHLDRQVNEQRSINRQKEMPPLLWQISTPGGAVSFPDLLSRELASQSLAPGLAKVLDFELSFYDTQAPALLGWDREFLASARLDNLLSCYVGLESFLEAGDAAHSLLVCNDHEEVGSQSHVGADGPFLKTVIERAFPDADARHRILPRSVLFSCDNAHGVHPNYPEKHDENHGPLLNGGPVIKVNANQRYATDSETSALFRFLCERAEVPCQSFVSRADMACGSTIGPLTASTIGVKTLDVGVPTFAMHSIRELAGSRDPHYLYRALVEFFRIDSWD